MSQQPVKLFDSVLMGLPRAAWHFFVRTCTFDVSYELRSSGRLLCPTFVVSNDTKTRWWFSRFDLDNFQFD